MFAGTAHCSQAYKKEFFLVRFWEFVYDYTTCINDWMSRFSDFLCWQTNKQTDRTITLPLADACSGVRKVYNHDFYSCYNGCNCKIVFVNILYQGYVWKKQRVCYCWLKLSLNIEAKLHSKHFIAGSSNCSWYCQQENLGSIPRSWKCKSM